MSASRRVEILQWAAKSGSWIMEDDYDSEFRFESRPIGALRDWTQVPRSFIWEPSARSCFQPCDSVMWLCPGAWFKRFRRFEMPQIYFRQRCIEQS
ncbi:hypothetical protein HDF14_002407 [Edaphobacter lichenicola]|uniref:Uncharacterized protein n=1 Tax=Tunturiibacter gelidiferens TaxID=3069689 RepID=A0A9X0U3V1_9BACT|nr:hypothetical protein [Edaphobacter lichenicola]